MNALLVALLLSQTTPTRANLIGSINLLETGVLAALDHIIEPTVNGTLTGSCLVRPAGVPSGTTTTRFGVTIISPSIQQILGMKLPSYATTWAEAKEEYAAMEIQAVPTEEITFDIQRTKAHLDVVWEETSVRPSAYYPGCEVAVVRNDDPLWGSVVRCACAISSACKAADGITAAPSKMTLSPGSFTPSAECKPKPCVGRFDGVGVDNTWPVVCPK
jgi:hypothetical protein